MHGVPRRRLVGERQAQAVHTVSMWSRDLVDLNGGHARGGWVLVADLPMATGVCLTLLDACPCRVLRVGWGNVLCSHRLPFRLCEYPVILNDTDSLKRLIW